MHGSDKPFFASQNRAHRLKYPMQKPDSSLQISLDGDLSDRFRACGDNEKISDSSLLEKLIRSYEIYDSQKMETFAIGDAIGYGIYIIDHNQIIRGANKTYEDLTGMWEKEYKGKSVQEVLEKLFINGRAVAVDALKSGKKTEGLGKPSRTDRELLVTSVPITDKNGKVSSVLTVLRDVTEQMSLQNNLNRNLEKTEIYEHELNYYRSRESRTRLLIGASPKIEAIKNLIAQVAPVDTTVLITGETGVGKEVVSRELHMRSGRKDYPYIRVNCAAIPESLMESELFGYEKGAFTGADNKRKLGFFEMANHGTILLDEIGEIPLPLQSKLLRVIQEKELRRLGGGRAIPVDVRILAATNKDLKEEVKAGMFRSDLYYRLCVIPVHVPPLRERLPDIQVLAEHFIDRYNRMYLKNKRLTPAAVLRLTHYDWPGNVRELENIIERLVVITREDEIDDTVVSTVVGIPDNPLVKSLMSSEGMNLKDAVAALESQMIESALRETGSSYKAAERLGMDQSTIIRKAKKLGIKDWKDASEG